MREREKEKREQERDSEGKGSEREGRGSTIFFFLFFREKVDQKNGNRFTEQLGRDRFLIRNKVGTKGKTEWGPVGGGDEMQKTKKREKKT